MEGFEYQDREFELKPVSKGRQDYWNDVFMATCVTGCYRGGKLFLPAISQPCLGSVTANCSSSVLSIEKAGRWSCLCFTKREACDSYHQHTAGTSAYVMPPVFLTASCMGKRTKQYREEV